MIKYVYDRLTDMKSGEIMVKLLSFSDTPIVINNVVISKTSYKKGKVFKGKTSGGKLLYLISGELKYDIEYILPLVVHEKEMIFLPESTSMKAEFIGENNTFISIDFNIISGCLYDNPSVFLSDDAKSEINTVMSEIDYLTEKNVIVNSSRIYSLIYNILYVIKGDCYYDLGKYGKISNAVESMKREFNVNYKLSDYARMCNMNVGSFRKLFTECTKMSPIAYRTKIRIRRANDLLSCGNYSKTEIAEKTGFNTVSYFWREYKKYEKYLK